MKTKIGKLQRDFIVLSIILVIIIGLEILTNYISEHSIERIVESLERVQKDLEKLDYEGNLELSENCKNQVSRIKEEWKNVDDKLSFFAEHNELEKVSYALNDLETNIANAEYDDALANLTESIFWLYHIEEKDSFKWKNIF